MIIDCHGHYTTEPKDLHRFRKEQTEAVKTRRRCRRASLKMSDDEIRESVEAPSSSCSASAAPTSRSSRRGPPAWATISATKASVLEWSQNLQRPDRARDRALSEQLHRRVSVAAIARRAAEEFIGELERCVKMGLRRLQPQSRSIWRLLQRSRR
jgi:4-oxalmesaconate hydratase